MNITNKSQKGDYLIIPSKKFKKILAKENLPQTKFSSPSKKKISASQLNQSTNFMAKHTDFKKF